MLVPVVDGRPSSNLTFLGPSLNLYIYSYTFLCDETRSHFVQKMFPKYWYQRLPNMKKQNKKEPTQQCSSFASITGGAIIVPCTAVPTELTKLIHTYIAMTGKTETSQEKHW